MFPSLFEPANYGNVIGKHLPAKAIKSSMMKVPFFELLELVSSLLGVEQILEHWVVIICRIVHHSRVAIQRIFDLLPLPEAVLGREGHRIMISIRDVRCNVGEQF